MHILNLLEVLLVKFLWMPLSLLFLYLFTLSLAEKL
jgi:hypothetical protein